jgi:hypothetical protein
MKKINFLATLQPLASSEAKVNLQAGALAFNGEISGLNFLIAITYILGMVTRPK